MSYRKNPITKILQNGVGATANGTTLDCSEYSTLGVQITGITSATITWEVSNDEANWVGILGALSSTGTGALTATANGLYIFDVSAIKAFRARISTHATGAIYATAFMKM